MNTDIIQYRGYFSGPKDTGGDTALYPTKEEAHEAVTRCRFSDETTWVNPEFVGMMDTVLKAIVPLEYTERRLERKTIQPGECFKAGDILVADYQVTRSVIALWLLTGKAEVV